MKHLLILTIIAISVLTSCASDTSIPKLKDGDIILHTSKSRQSKVVQALTDSKYSHIGIIIYKGDAPYVFEAVQPVKITPLNKWIQRGVDGSYSVLRSKDELTESQLYKMEVIGKSYIGKNYDSKFKWDDNEMYCSELVWKLYNAGAGIKLCDVATFDSFNLNGKATEDLIKKRYPNGIPLKETVVSPSQIYESNKLTEIYNNY